MRGHVRKRGEKWVVIVDVGRDEKGKRVQKWHSGFARRREADAKLAEILGQLAQATYVNNSKVTLAAFLTDWLAAVRPSIRPSTWASYRMNLVEHVIPILGNVPLQAVTPRHLNKLYADLQQSGRRDGRGLSARSTRYCYMILRKALSSAVRQSLVVRNVADFSDPPKPGPAPQMPAWTALELRQFLASVADDRLYPALRLMGYTGVRRGELLGLRWRDVDLDAGRISITQTLLAVGYELSFSDPKTKKSRRSVTLDAVTVTALREHRQQQLAERLAWSGSYQNKDLVFAREDGSPVHPDQFSARFSALVKASGLPRISVHGLRHTYASIALAAGVHPKVVQERLGHSTVAITLDTYSHVAHGMQEEAAETVARAIAG